MPPLLNATASFNSVNSCQICNRYMGGAGLHICETPAYPTMPDTFPQLGTGAKVADQKRVRNNETLGRYLLPGNIQVLMEDDVRFCFPHNYDLRSPMASVLTRVLKAIDSGIAKTFDYALRNLISKDQSGMLSGLMGPSGKVAKIRLGDFAAAGRASQLAVIDTFFNATVMWVRPETAFFRMYEPDLVVANQSLMTSGQPGYGRALKRHGIGFRCEKLVDLDRVRTKGFEPLYRNMPVAEGVLGHRVRGTIMDRAVNRYRDMGLFLCNKDAIGETAICISRNMRGAGKFPDATWVGDGILCAVKPEPTTLGFDTEAWQIAQRDKDATALWRPGEKLFPAIGAKEILAYVNVRKLGGGEEDPYYSFDIVDTNWTPLGGWPWTTPADRSYLQGELNALRAVNNGRIVVTRKEDFALKPGYEQG